MPSFTSNVGYPSTDVFSYVLDDLQGAQLQLQLRITASRTTSP